MKTFDSLPTILKSPKRSIIATTLTVIYLMISLSPLALTLMDSKKVAHSVTGECSGDCTICGCSEASRETGRCCCSKKKQQQQQQAILHEDGHDANPDCCNKVAAKKKTVIASCGSPCGSGEQIALPASDTNELLPVNFTEQFTLTHTDTTFINQTNQLLSRYKDPPDPPPKLSALL